MIIRWSSNDHQMIIRCLSNNHNVLIICLFVCLFVCLFGMSPKFLQIWFFLFGFIPWEMPTALYNLGPYRDVSRVFTNLILCLILLNSGDIPTGTQFVKHCRHLPRWIKLNQDILKAPLCKVQALSTKFKPNWTKLHTGLWQRHDIWFEQTKLLLHMW